jgi:hypothetical protein
MKITVTILLLFISILSFGQGLQDTLLKELKALDVRNNKNVKLFAGSFIVSDGFGGYTYRLDTTGVFERAEFADIGGSQISEKGKFRVNTNHQIELRSEKGYSTFNVFTFDTFFFLIRPAKLAAFKKDFTKAVSVFGKKRIYKIGNESKSAHFMIAYSLLSEYLVKGID